MLKANELIYEKIEHHIRSQIESGALHAGDRMLSEREIAKQFKSSVVTVRKAMKPLIDSGAIEKIHGKGTFVKGVARPADTGRLAVLYCHSRAGLFASSFYMSIVSGIEGEAAVAKKNIMLRSLLRDPAEDPAAVVHEMAGECDGILVLDPPQDMYCRIETALIGCSVPVVVVNNSEVAPTLDAVGPDADQDIRTVISFLKEAGHRHIACAYSRSQRTVDLSSNFKRRISCFRDTLRAEELPCNDDQVVCFDFDKPENDASLIDPADLSLFFSYDASFPVFDSLFNRPDPVTALFCTGDEVALFAYKLAHRRGVRIPDELTVIGYDGMNESGMIRPGLTTLKTPLTEMGAAAVRRLMEKNAERAAGAVMHRRISLAGTLIKRESHKDINQ